MKIIVFKSVTKKVIDNAASGSNATQARILKGWTYREAAEKVGCSFAYLSDLEKGLRSWGGKIANKYADLLAK